MEPTMNIERPARDSRTPQSQTAGAALVVLLLVHLVSFLVANHSQALVSLGYLLWTCALLPLATLGATFTFQACGMWHWGQSILVMLGTLLLSFFQFLILGGASAA
jgi:hypothetical protein